MANMPTEHAAETMKTATQSENQPYYDSPRSTRAGSPAHHSESTELDCSIRVADERQHGDKENRNVHDTSINDRVTNGRGQGVDEDPDGSSSPHGGLHGRTMERNDKTTRPSCQTVNPASFAYRVGPDEQKDLSRVFPYYGNIDIGRQKIDMLLKGYDFQKPPPGKHERPVAKANHASHQYEVFPIPKHLISQALRSGNTSQAKAKPEPRQPADKDTSISTVVMTGLAATRRKIPAVHGGSLEGDHRVVAALPVDSDHCGPIAGPPCHKPHPNRIAGTMQEAEKTSPSDGPGIVDDEAKSDTAASQDGDHERQDARMFLMKCDWERQSPRAGDTCITDKMPSLQYLGMALETRHKLIKKPKVPFQHPYLAEFTSKGKVYLNLSGTYPSSTPNGRLLYRPEETTMHGRYMEIGQVPSLACVGPRIGDFVIKRTSAAYTILEDALDHLRAWKAELREEWARNNRDRVHLLEAYWYETLADGPKRIPSAPEHDTSKITAAKIFQRDVQHTALCQRQEMARDLLFVRGKAIAGSPGLGDRDDCDWINAVTGEKVLFDETANAVVLPETEEMFARLAYFFSHNQEKWDAAEAEDDLESWLTTVVL